MLIPVYKENIAGKIKSTPQVQYLQIWRTLQVHLKMSQIHKIRYMKAIVEGKIRIMRFSERSE